MATLLAAVAVAVGGSVGLTSSAMAAPADPVTFVDQALEDAVNDALGNPAGTTITEGDAATITALNASGLGITDLTGLEHLTGLTNLILIDNQITDVSPLGGLPDIEYLHLAENDISDISPLAGLTTLTDLYLFDNDISDVSDMSGLTLLEYTHLDDNSITDVSPLQTLSQLKVLHITNNGVSDVSALDSLTSVTSLRLAGNSISDISPLAGLSSVTHLSLDGQSLSVAPAVAGSSTPNPVIGLDADPVAIASTDPGFTYQAATDEWSFTTSGTKTLTWAAPVTLGEAEGIEFSGTISQVIEPAPLVPATPQAPEVVQAACASGEVVDPRIDLPTTEGIAYTIEGDVAPGSTVIVRAVPADDSHYIAVDPGSGWAGNSDGLYATLEITLETVSCDPAPVTDEPDGDLPVVVDPPADGDAPRSSSGLLPRTGGPILLTGILGAALLGSGGALLLASRSRRTA